MEDHFNKKSIIYVFIVLLLIFLFIYKGFILSGDEYFEEFALFRNTTIKSAQSSLKRGKLFPLASRPENLSTKAKIPKELSNIDNNILEMKAIEQSIANKYTKIINDLEKLNNVTILDQNYSNLTGEIKSIIEDIKSVKASHNNFDKHLEDLGINAEALRNF